MSISLNERLVSDIQLLYRNNRKTKWLAEVLLPHYEESIKIYLTRPADEKKDRLKNLIQNCRSLSELLKENSLMA